MEKQETVNKKNRIKFEADFTDEQYVKHLTSTINKFQKDEANILFSELNPVTGQIMKGLSKINPRRFNYYVLAAPQKTGTAFPGTIFYKTLVDVVTDKTHIDLIVCVSTLSNRIYAFFGEIQKFPVLAEIPFIYKVRGSETYPLLDEQDQWKELGIAEKHVYLTNQFDDGLFEDIYRYSLTKVKRKCQIRDAYDLFQCLEQSKDIAGDIIEFGTYEGHSGLLLAEYIKRKKLPKKLYLCDTFKEFPKFDYGIDKPWSHFHNKNFNFAHVKSIFKPYEFVTLVKGDFRETLRHIPCDSFSFAYVDCDSYEATRFVSDFIYPELSTGGCIVFEDYGHHTLLGARRAVDEFTTENRGSLFSFFSFFSGLKIVVKRK